MDPLTIILGVTALASFFTGAYSFTRGLQEDERQRKLEEQGRDPVSLTEKQIAISEDTANKNFDLQQQQFEYQKQLNETLMQREDTAMQRQVNDLKAAGLSPLMLAGGAAATPLTSATAPQKDISGINTAINNLMGAYNDVFNRRMNKQQFALNTAAQTAQLYTQIAESKLNQKKIKLENDILDLDYTYYKNHPERNLGLTQVLTNLASGILQKNGSAIDLLSGSIPSNNPVASGDSVPSGNRTASNIIDFLKNPKELVGNLNIPGLSKNKNVIKTSDLKKDTDFLQEQQNKSYKLALNAVETRANKKDEKLLNAIDFLWNNSTANDYFLDKESFKNKVITDSSYRKNIAKNLKLKPYKNPFEY